MPYIRTLNANSITERSAFYRCFFINNLFDILFFFRSFRATLISILIVVIMCGLWTSWFISFEITVPTALVPTLVIVIGIPNCIFNKYQQEYSAHGNKARALQRVITKVGTAT
jgi:predicted RND superfamily exporter protein